MSICSVFYSMLFKLAMVLAIVVNTSMNPFLKCCLPRLCTFQTFLFPLVCFMPALLPLADTLDKLLITLNHRIFNAKQG